jgi:hypothetical protein
MLPHTETKHMSKLNITPELRQGIADHIAANLVVKANQKGTSEYLTLDNTASNVDNIGGYGFRINFATMGMRPASEASKSRVERATASVAKLSPEEKAALLEELTK